MKARLQELYRDDTRVGRRFRYGLLVFDLATVGFVIATSFVEPAPWIEAIDVVLGLVILTEFLARLRVEGDRRTLLRVTTWTDVIAIASFLAPIAGEGFGFLRVLRTLRLLHTYQILRRLRADFPWFRRHQEIILAATNLCVFLFVMTGLIYATQSWRNPQIGNYIDALYFTVTALTTTGFGDITLEGTLGRLLSVLVMFVGVTLFLRLAQVLFRPRKVRHECPDCGLRLHDADAVHCKHCGRTLHIETDGYV